MSFYWKTFNVGMEVLFADRDRQLWTGIYGIQFNGWFIGVIRSWVRISEEKGREEGGKP